MGGACRLSVCWKLEKSNIFALKVAGLGCDLLVLVQCVFWSSQSKQTSTNTQLKHFILPSADKSYGDADFIFHQDLTPSNTDERYQKLAHNATVAADMSNLNLI